jgi:hypothetical protein
VLKAEKDVQDIKAKANKELADSKMKVSKEKEKEQDGGESKPKAPKEGENKPKPPKEKDQSKPKAPKDEGKPKQPRTIAIAPRPGPPKNALSSPKESFTNTLLPQGSRELAFDQNGPPTDSSSGRIVVEGQTVVPSVLEPVAPEDLAPDLSEPGWHSNAAALRRDRSESKPHHPQRPSTKAKTPSKPSPKDPLRPLYTHEPLSFASHSGSQQEMDADMARDAGNGMEGQHARRAHEI